MTQEQSSKRSLEFLDTMSVRQLRQLLKAEFEADGADVELIRNITTVLASKDETGLQDIDVDSAYKAFVADYSQTEPLFAEVIDEMDSAAQKAAEKSRKKTTFRIAICIAAVIAFLIGATLTASAFGFNLWGWFTRWTDNDFRFVPAETASTSEPVSEEYADIPSALAGMGITEPLYPTWIPEGFELHETMINTSSPITMVATYLRNSNSNGIVIRITETKVKNFENIYEKDQSPLMQYEKDHNLHYVFENNEKYTAVWHTSGYEVTITGNISLDEMIKTIDSIYEEVKDETSQIP